MEAAPLAAVALGVAAGCLLLPLADGGVFGFALEAVFVRNLPFCWLEAEKSAFLLAWPGGCCLGLA